MSRVLDRLTDLGITLPSVAAPIGSYVPALVDGDLVWTSGQLPFVDGRIEVAGIVGDSVVENGVDPRAATSLARICAVNALAAVASVVDLDRVVRVVKVVGYVASTPEFTGQPGVVNGASELIGEVFGDAGRHARSAVGVASLPLGAPVEVELVVRIEPAAAARS